VAKTGNSIKKFDFNDVVTGPAGFDYSTVETVFKARGPLMIRSHRHEYHEILWFTNCSGVHFVDFAAYKFEPHTLFFIAKNQIHAFEGRVDIRGHRLRFNDYFIRRHPEILVSFLQSSVFSSMSSPRRMIPQAQVPRFENLMRLIIAEASNPLSYHFEEMMTLLLKAFVLKSERLGPNIGETSGARLARMQIFCNFVAFVKINYRKHLKVQDYARALNIETQRLTQVCKTVSGLSAKEIIQERIILEAKRYLWHSNLSVNEICHRLGFKSSSDFNDYFQNVTSMSPSEFRYSISKIYK